MRVTGTVEKDDEFAAPTVSIPLIPPRLFWEKCGVTRDYALRMLREAITEAMLDGVKEDATSRATSRTWSRHQGGADRPIEAAQDAAGKSSQGSHGHRHLRRETVLAVA